MYSPQLHSHTHNPTKYQNLPVNISQVYTLEQQVQSTSYTHYVHLSCNVKLKSYSIFTIKKRLFTEKNICNRKKYQ